MMVKDLLQFQGDNTSLAEAIETAVGYFACQRSDLEIEILQSPRQGFLGVFGKKKAVIRAQVVSRELAGRLILERLLALAGLTGTVNVVYAGPCPCLNITCDNGGLVIGRHGQTIDSLETVTNSLLERVLPAGERLIIDCQGYRRRRQAQLLDIADKLMTRARKNCRPVSSDALPDSQIKIMQQLIEKSADIRVHSRGQGVLRKLVVVARNRAC